MSYRRRSSLSRAQIGENMEIQEHLHHPIFLDPQQVCEECSMVRQIDGGREISLSYAGFDLLGGARPQCLREVRRDVSFWEFLDVLSSYEGRRSLAGDSGQTLAPLYTSIADVWCDGFQRFVVGGIAYGGAELSNYGERLLAWTLKCDS